MNWIANAGANTPGRAGQARRLDAARSALFVLADQFALAEQGA